MSSDTLHCLFCGESVDNQDVDTDLEVYIATCDSHGYHEVEFFVTEDNKDVLSEFLSYGSHWAMEDYSTQDTVETIREVFCPLCGDKSETTVAVYHDVYSSWDTYVFDCDAHGRFQVNVDCEMVRGVDAWNEEFS